MRKKVLLILSFAILIFGGLTNKTFAQNLTPSGSFESGEMWNSWAKNGGVASFSVVTDAVDAPEGSNYMKIDVDTLGLKNYNIQTVTPTFQVVKNSVYEVIWWAKSDTAGKTMNLYFTDPAGQQYGGKKTLTTEWAEYSKTWTADSTGDCIIKINWENVAEYSLDSFVVVDPTFVETPPSANLLLNGGFEEGTTEGWNNLAGGGSTATYSIETTDAPEGLYYMKVDLDTLGSNDWSVQSFTPEFMVLKDSTYKISWLAKSDVDGARMRPILQLPTGQNYSPFIELTTEWQTYNVSWTSDTTTEAAEAYVKFWWSDLAEYYVDNFIVEDPAFDPGLQPQTIDFPTIGDKNTTDAPFTVLATASSDLSVTLTIVSGPATLDGNTVTLTGDPGTITIKASQEGNDNYNPATDVEQSFNVFPPGWVEMQTLELDVKYVLEPITIDGVANEPEWGGPAMRVNAATYFNDDSNDPDYYTSDITSDDLSAWFKVLWSEAGVYVYADITDDVIHTDSLDIHTNGGAHQYDNLEVYFHVPMADWTEDLKASESYVNSTFQMRSNIGVGDYWSGRSPYATDGGQGWTSSALDGFYEYVFSSKEAGVTFEAFYPFEKLFGGSTAALPSRLGDERSILFEFAYGDSDGEGAGGVRAGGIVWNTIPDILNSYSDLAAHDRTQFGQLNLTTEIADGTSSNDLNVIDNSVKVYPTRFNDYIRIQSEYKVVDVRLYNALGMEVLHLYDLGGIEYVNQLDALNAGLYFLKMKSGNKLRTFKLIKN